MDANMFWIIDRPIHEFTNFTYATVVSGGRILEQRSVCERCDRATYNEVTRDLRVELYNNNLAGIVWTDSADIVIELTLARELEALNLIGFSFREVIVESWWGSRKVGGPIINFLDEVPPPKLVMLIIHGRVHAINPNTGTDKRCKVCNRLEMGSLSEGFSINQTKWDGSDIFYIGEYPAIPIISGKFYQKLQDLGIDNFSLVKTEDFKS